MGGSGRVIERKLIATVRRESAVVAAAMATVPENSYIFFALKRSRHRLRNHQRHAGHAAHDPSPNIPDQKLDAAAAAMERVASLKQDYQQRIAAAAPSDKERIANEAINVLAKAITDQGLSVEEYDSILEVAQKERPGEGDWT
jgi:hypothetical protein